MKAKIYQIINTQDDQVYIGSTRQRFLNDRLWRHSSSSMDSKANGHNCKLYQHMRKLGQGYEGFKRPLLHPLNARGDFDWDEFDFTDWTQYV